MRYTQDWSGHFLNKILIFVLKNEYNFQVQFMEVEESELKKWPN